MLRNRDNIKPLRKEMMIETLNEEMWDEELLTN